MTAPRVELRIRRLVLHTANGPAQAAAVRAALEAELAELLSQTHVDGARDRQVHRAAAWAGAEADPAALGRRIARAVHHALYAGEPGGPRRGPGDPR
ncbi:hypothetical protein OIU91_09715 [Streptomyces sp. NBC_01456]|uniref:hypothetical protein n=1 Tax=unclassified Streptomyces TaxID=2593676 RepID=UPI002E301733|nr:MULTISPECIES: hypothetical protein [unclassified Streptomyces]